jgi:hypothetical protein
MLTRFDHSGYRPVSARRPASVIRTRATSIVCRPATTRAAVAVASPARTRSIIPLGREAVREHDSFGATSRQEEAIRARGGGNPKSSFVELRRGFAASRQGDAWGWDWETGDQNSEDFIDLQGHEQNPRAQRYMVGDR